MSYIKREDAKNAIMNCIGEQTVSRYATSAECRAARHGADLALFALDDIPTADVVEVVRCKDCKFAKHCYGDVFDCTCPITPWASDEYSIFTNANDYCSYGERSEDNEG